MHRLESCFRFSTTYRMFLNLIIHSVQLDIFKLAHTVRTILQKHKALCTLVLIVPTHGGTARLS